jgi:hypothetical protein
VSDETDYPNVRRGFAERGVPELHQKFLLEMMREEDARREARRKLAELTFPREKRPCIKPYPCQKRGGR